jgi:HEAT repeat protein
VSPHLASCRVVRLAALLLAVVLPAVAGAAGRLSFEDLLANLKSPNVRTRTEAASALGKSRRRDAVSALSALVRDPEAKVRLEVVRALREIRDPAAIPAYVALTEDGDPAVRAEAVAGLVDLYIGTDRASGGDRFLDVFAEQYDSGAPPQARVDASVLRALTLSLRDDDKGIREQSALALGVLGARGSLKELAAALQDPEPAVRGAAALAIAKLRGFEHAKALIGLLEDDAGSVRVRVIQALGILRIKEAGKPLRETFEANRKKDLGLKALDALSKVADPSQADLFKELLQDADVDRKRLAIEGLARVSGAGMLPDFKKDYQREKNEELKIAFSFGITLLGDRAFVDTIVLNVPSRTYGKRCREYILELGHDILADLYPYLSDPDADIRAELCDVLAMMADPEAIARLTPLLNDPSAQVADRANRAIERLHRASGEAAAR